MTKAQRAKDRPTLAGRGAHASGPGAAALREGAVGAGVRDSQLVTHPVAGAGGAPVRAL